MVEGGTVVDWVVATSWKVSIPNTTNQTSNQAYLSHYKTHTPPIEVHLGPCL